MKKLLMRVCRVTTLYSQESKEIEGYVIELLSVIDGGLSTAIEVRANISPKTSEDDLRLLTELGTDFHLQLCPVQGVESLDWEVPA